MAEYLLYFIITIVSLLAIIKPWIGILSYYLLALMAPQNIWWWIFRDIRVSAIVAGATIIGMLFGLIRNKFILKHLVNGNNLLVLLLWLFITISFIFGPYVKSYQSEGLSPKQIYEITNKMILFYFLGCLAIDKISKLRYFFYLYAFITLYYIYWANVQYFTSSWYQFNFGRLMGPIGMEGGSIYKDENMFAMVFITGLPFIYYIGIYQKHRIAKYFILSFIPFGWHSVFLTGSRGGLLGLLCISLVAIAKSKNKAMSILLILILGLFYQLQGGDVIKDRSKYITDYKGEGSAEMRLTAWKGGIKMIQAHPITGVGLGSFITAVPNFIETSGRVAHNTFIQYVTESGIGAGICFIMISIGFIKSCKKNEYVYEKDFINSNELRLINEAIFASFCGLLVVSLFLSLNTYDIYFYLLIINKSIGSIARQSKVQTCSQAGGVVLA